MSKVLVTNSSNGNQDIGITSEKGVDNVNHPHHYEGSTSLECIQVMELIFGINAVCIFCLCNSFKYLWRYKNKNGEEDINKARWYILYVEDTLERATVENISEDVLKIYHRVNDLFVRIINKIAKEGI